MTAGLLATVVWRVDIGARFYARQSADVPGAYGRDLDAASEASVEIRLPYRPGLVIVQLKNRAHVGKANVARFLIPKALLLNNQENE